MKKRIYYALLFLGLGGIFISWWGLLGNSVSQKYEVVAGDCISAVSGTNLCLVEDILIATEIVCGLLVMYSMYKLALDIKKK